MAKKSKPKTPKFTTPESPWIFPKLTEPDYGTKEYPKPAGEYNVQIVVQRDDPATQSLLKQLEPLHREAVREGEEAFAKLKPAARKKLKELTVNDVYEIMYDDETEEETGEIKFKFKMKASGVNQKTGKKWSRRPAIFDANVRQITGKELDNLEIWGGTEGIIRFTTRPYFVEGQGMAGLSLLLDAVQITELRGPGMGASADGFESHDGGFSREDIEESEDSSGTEDEDQPEGHDEDDVKKDEEEDF